MKKLRKEFTRDGERYKQILDSPTAYIYERTIPGITKPCYETFKITTNEEEEMKKFYTL
jgi:hypothetical protein